MTSVTLDPIMNEQILAVIGGVKGGVVLAAKVTLPSLVPLVMFAEGLIDEKTVVPMTIVAAVGGACWYLNGRLTRIEDAIETLQEDSKNSKTHHAQLCPLLGSNNTTGQCDGPKRVILKD